VLLLLSHFLLERLFHRKANLPELFVLQYEGKEFWQDSSIFTLKDFISSVENNEITKQKAEDQKSKNPFNQALDVFLGYMPYSALVMAAMFLITYLAFLPEEKRERYFGSKEEVPTESNEETKKGK
jgi:hypothetical protein